MRKFRAYWETESVPWRRLRSRLLASLPQRVVKDLSFHRCWAAERTLVSTGGEPDCMSLEHLAGVGIKGSEGCRGGGAGLSAGEAGGGSVLTKGEVESWVATLSI